MAKHSWRAKWDGSLIEIRYEAVPFSGLDPSFGRYPTAEIIIDGVPLTHRAGDEHDRLEVQVALPCSNGDPTSLNVLVHCHPDGPGCEIRVADQLLEVL